MKLKLNIFASTVALVFVLLGLSSHAQQDPMYTQYMFNTQTVNPAYAGSWESVGFMVLARQQWAGLQGAPETYTFSFQSPLKNEKIALGLNVVQDKIGFEKRFSLFADYSYKVKLTEETSLRMGLKAGFSNYSNNFTDYTLFPGEEMDPLFQGEIDNKMMPNFGIGALLQNPRYYIGLSVPKIIHNEFKDNYNNYSIQSEMRHYYLIAGMVFDMGNNLKFKPTLLSKVVPGAPVQLDFTANFLLKEKLWLGAMYRTGSSYGFIAQWIFNQKLRFGYAIDFTTTKLNNLHNGTHEVMVSYEIRFSKENVESPRYF